MDDLNSIKVLLIEDNRDFANLVELFLRKHEPDRFTVVWKENGQAALAVRDEHVIELRKIRRRRINPFFCVLWKRDGALDNIAGNFRAGMRGRDVAGEHGAQTMALRSSRAICRKDMRPGMKF